MADTDQEADPELVSRIEILMRRPPFTSTGSALTNFPWYYRGNAVDGALPGRSFIRKDFGEAGHLTEHFGLREYAPQNFTEFIDDVYLTQSDLLAVQRNMMDRLLNLDNVRMILQVMDDRARPGERDLPENKAYLKAVFEAVGVDRAVIESGNWDRIRAEFIQRLPGDLANRTYPKGWTSVMPEPIEAVPPSEAEKINPGPALEVITHSPPAESPEAATDAPVLELQLEAEEGNASIVIDAQSDAILGEAQEQEPSAQGEEPAVADIARRVILQTGSVLKEIWDRAVSPAEEYGVKNILETYKEFFGKRPDTLESYRRAMADNAQGTKDCAVDLIWRSRGNEDMVRAGISLLEYAADRGNLQAGRDLVTLLVEGGVNGREFSKNFLPDYAKDESRLALAYELAVNLRAGATLRLSETYNDYSLGERSADRAAFRTLGAHIETIRKLYPEGVPELQASEEAAQNMARPQGAFNPVQI